ncbi:hypothetical protein P154DRAFT_521758 [Amniculicola lignicola CBS 123094]|uniref:Uncharacterized protein n=1 Tax=Amniculicola lignicola CBS 123094 TaxID=1392246 RepID=A0A6A5WMH0_9PLEO|nr:hypothetical protein P154DRAFT_521758 [Amniculicola lignicola CBS 123094]
MPRPKRQRPLWLPAWVPFKDGRVLGLAKQTVLAWSSAALATVFFTLTVSYATEKSQFSKVKFVHSSRPNTLLVLRVLSEIASVFLAATIYSTFEVVQWVLISRPDGIRLPQFLALQSSTGPLGLLALALGYGLPASKWPWNSRILSLIRLLAEVAVPVLGVFVMSNVNTHVEYTPITNTLTPFAFGMEPFNYSIAAQLGVMEDLLFNMYYVSFLYNPIHAIDLSPHMDGCSKGMSLSGNTSCIRRVLVTQDFQNVEANLPFHDRTDTHPILGTGQQLYSLEYRDNIEVSKTDLICETLNSGPEYYQICGRNAEDGWLHLAMIPCPVSTVMRENCAKDTSWKSDPGYTTALRPSFLKASIAYDRHEATILSHKIETEPAVAQINSSELISALGVLLNATKVTPPTSVSNSILGAPSNFFGRIVAGHMYRITKMSETNPSARVKGVNALQSILAMTLFYCQNGVLAKTVLPYAPNANGTSPQYRNGAFMNQRNDSQVALAETRYRLSVGRATLITYFVLGGATLIICIFALLLGSIVELVKFDAEPTLWPALDFYTQCRVETGDGALVPAQKRAELAWIYHGKELFDEIAGLRVTRRKRKMREIGDVVEPIGNNEGP